MLLPRGAAIVIEENLTKNLLTWICSKCSRILLSSYWPWWAFMGRSIYVPKPPKKRGNSGSISKIIARVVLRHFHTRNELISAASSQITTVCFSFISVLSSISAPSSLVFPS